MTDKIRLDEYELSIENEILGFESLSQEEKIKIEKIMDTIDCCKSSKNDQNTSTQRTNPSG